MPRRKVNRVRKPVKNICALADVLSTRTPISYALPAQEDKCAFLVSRRCSNNVSRLQAAHRHTHPLPARLFAVQVQEFSRLLRGQILGMDQRDRFTHFASTSANFHAKFTFSFHILTGLRLYKNGFYLVKSGGNISRYFFGDIYGRRAKKYLVHSIGQRRAGRRSGV